MRTGEGANTWELNPQGDSHGSLGHPHGFEGYEKMVVEVPDSSWLTRSITTCSYPTDKHKVIMKAQAQWNPPYVKYKFKEQAQSKKSMITTTYSQEKDNLKLKSLARAIALDPALRGLAAIDQKYKMSGPNSIKGSPSFR
ncbi:hypothetical protein Tco_0152688 [Tanacetum coccineum]